MFKDKRLNIRIWQVYVMDKCNKKEYDWMLSLWNEVYIAYSPKVNVL